jgi:hypothetical protein
VCSSDLLKRVVQPITVLFLAIDICVELCTNKVKKHLDCPRLS